MKLFKTKEGIYLTQDQNCWLVGSIDQWDELINRDDLGHKLKEITETECKILQSDLLDQTQPNAPIGKQEVWAAGVTYHSSRLARMEESKKASGGDFYSRVYGAERPEIFFKANANRVVGPNQDFRIRADSIWDVPEPELTLFATSSGKIVGYTIGNDVSSRSIEGENPLYLPQAKTFDDCACLGPCLYVPKHPLSLETEIKMSIKRDGERIFSGSTTLSKMKRKPEELVEYLFRETSFADGVFLMTGTGIVPDREISLKANDEVCIFVDGIGELSNKVASNCHRLGNL